MLRSFSTCVRSIRAPLRQLALAPAFQTCEPAPSPTCLNDVYSVDDFQRLARVVLPKDVYEYIASGSDDEETLRADRSGFQRLALRPRVLRDVSGLDCSVSNFCGTGLSLALPVFASPAGVHAVAHREAECATALACESEGTLFGHSQHATKTIEEVAEAAPNSHRWYQAYILRNRDDTAALVRRALASGVRGIFLTVDSVRFGFREADARNGFSGLPEGLELANYRTAPGASGWDSREHAAWDQNTEAMFAEDVSWDDVGWLREVITAHSGGRHIPLVVKGVMCGEDALCAVGAGADGVMVSTHGGRQLDGTLGAIEALPEVVAAVQNCGSQCDVLLDSGVRRGTDVVKALALGASAVGVGRPLFFALAVGGAAGVRKLLQMLKTETETAMALLGCRTVGDINESHVHKR